MQRRRHSYHDETNNNHHSRFRSFRTNIAWQHHLFKAVSGGSEVGGQSPPFSSSFWKSARLRRWDCLSPSFHRISRWSVEHVTKAFSLKLTNIWRRSKRDSWSKHCDAVCEAEEFVDHKKKKNQTWTAPECPIRSPVSSSVLMFGTSTTFFDGGPVCLFDRPKVHIPKNPDREQRRMID